MPPSASLAERVALVVGGASGLGRGAAEALAAAGARVVIADREEVRVASPSARADPDPVR